MPVPIVDTQARSQPWALLGPSFATYSECSRPNTRMCACGSKVMLKYGSDQPWARSPTRTNLVTNLRAFFIFKYLLLCACTSSFCFVFVKACNGSRKYWRFFSILSNEWKTLKIMAEFRKDMCEMLKTRLNFTRILLNGVIDFQKQLLLTWFYRWSKKIC